SATHVGGHGAHREYRSRGAAGLDWHADERSTGAGGGPAVGVRTHGPRSMESRTAGGDPPGVRGGATCAGDRRGTNRASARGILPLSGLLAALRPHDRAARGRRRAPGSAGVHGRHGLPERDRPALPAPDLPFDDRDDPAALDRRRPAAALLETVSHPR